MNELSIDNLETILKDNEKVIVQYGASWCGVCRILKPKFIKLADENQDIAFVYVDAEKFPNARSFASVDNLPTFAAFTNGKLVKQATGSSPNIIQEVMSEVTSN